MKMRKSILTVLIMVVALESFGQEQYGKTFEFGEYHKEWALVEKTVC
jgi:hypothetical protein